MDSKLGPKLASEVSRNGPGAHAPCLLMLAYISSANVVQLSSGKAAFSKRLCPTYTHQQWYINNTQLLTRPDTLHRIASVRQRRFSNVLIMARVCSQAVLSSFMCCSQHLMHLLLPMRSGQRHQGRRSVAAVSSPAMMDAGGLPGPASSVVAHRHLLPH